MAGTRALGHGDCINGIKIHSGYCWNGASVPWFLWPIIGSPFDPPFMAPSLFHDRVYDTGELPRKKADLLFKKLLIHNGVSVDLAKQMYAGVRIGGRSHYNYKGKP